MVIFSYSSHTSELVGHSQRCTPLGRNIGQPHLAFFEQPSHQR